MKARYLAHFFLVALLNSLFACGSGSESTSIQSENDSNQLPIVIIKANGLELLDQSLQVNKGDTVTFSASDSSDPDGRVTSYQWLHSEISALQSTLEQVTITFNHVGTESINLTLSDDDGGEKQYNFLVTVKNVTSEQPVAPKLSAFPADVSRPASSFNVTLNVEGDGIIQSSYSLDGSDPKTQGLPFVNGQVITITLSVGEVVELKLYSINTASEVSRHYTYSESANSQTLATFNYKFYNNGDFQDNAPVTFALPFAANKIPAASLFELWAGEQQLKTQVDVKVLEQGFIRHAIVSTVVPSMTEKQLMNLQLKVKNNIAATYNDDSQLVLQEVIDSAKFIDKGAAITVDGKTYRADLQDSLVHLKEHYHDIDVWLNGPDVKEWHMRSALFDKHGDVLDNFEVRYHLRYYKEADKFRLDSIIENGAVYESTLPKFQNITATFSFDDQVTENYTHFAYARYRKTQWTGSHTEVLVIPEINDLIDSKTIPNYPVNDPMLVTRFANVNKMEGVYRDWSAKDVTYCLNESKYPMTCDGSEAFSFYVPDIRGPMGIGAAMHHMSSPGGRKDIGPIPAWANQFLINMNSDKIAIADIAFLADYFYGMSESSGSWPIHYKVTDKSALSTALGVNENQVSVAKAANHTIPIAIAPVQELTAGFKHASLDRRQTDGHMGLCDTSADSLDEKRCATPYRPEAAHQPSYAYVPYLLTGDFFYLEELWYWNSFTQIWPLTSEKWGRNFDQGLFTTQQVRHQAWSYRTLAEAAFITPSSHALKPYFTKILANNTQVYLDRRDINDYGGIYRPHSDGPLNALWQDDYFTWALIHAYNLGLVDPKGDGSNSVTELAKWKVRFPIYRFGTGSPIDNSKEQLDFNSMCWIFGGAYYVHVSDEHSPAIDQYWKTMQAFVEGNKNSGETNTLKFHSEAAKLPCDSPEQAQALGIEAHQMAGYGGQLGTPMQAHIGLAPAIDFLADLENKTEQEQRLLQQGYVAWGRLINRYDPYKGLAYKVPNFAVVPRDLQPK